MNALKKLPVLAVVLMVPLLSHSCIFDDSEKVSGNGKVVKQERDVSHFNSIDASGVFNIYFLQGEKESLVIESDENLLPLIETKVEGNALIIGQKDHFGIRNARKKNIYITLKSIDHLTINSVGNIQTSSLLHLKSLKLDHSGVGNVKLEFDCDKLIADIHSVGQLTLKGKVNFAEIKNSSVGNVNASEFFVDTLHLENSSIGNLKIHAEKEVFVNSSGIGNVSIEGNAIVKELSSTGIGKVVKK
jgi:hypothetical protein